MREVARLPISRGVLAKPCLDLGEQLVVEVADAVVGELRERAGLGGIVGHLRDGELGFGDVGGQRHLVSTRSLPTVCATWSGPTGAAGPGAPDHSRAPVYTS